MDLITEKSKRCWFLKETQLARPSEIRPALNDLIDARVISSTSLYCVSARNCAIGSLPPGLRFYRNQR